MGYSLPLTGRPHEPRVRWQNFTYDRPSKHPRTPVRDEKKSVLLARLSWRSGSVRRHVMAVPTRISNEW
jgi:hypothetical protein